MEDLSSKDDTALTPEDNIIDEIIPEIQGPEYAGILVRVKAVMIDSIVLTLWILFIPPLISNESLRVMLIFMPVILYEPVLVTSFGSTLGQWIMKLKVLDEKSLTKTSFFYAFIRTCSKYILGWLSFVYILFSDKNKAIHDSIGGTVVIYDPNRVKPDEFTLRDNEKESIEYIYPSGFRKFIMFIVWYLGVILVLTFVITMVLLMMTDLTLDEEGNFPKKIDHLLNLLIFVVFIVFIILTLKGLLPGAKKKLKKN